jgi:hypothetical protein
MPAIADIDAPERKQPFGKKVNDYLASLIASKDVRVDWSKHDRYGRIVGKIIYDQKDVDLGITGRAMPGGIGILRASRPRVIASSTKRRKSKPWRNGGGCELIPILCRRGSGEKDGERIDEEGDVGASGRAFSVHE